MLYCFVKIDLFFLCLHPNSAMREVGYNTMVVSIFRTGTNAYNVRMNEIIWARTNSVLVVRQSK